MTKTSTGAKVAGGALGLAASAAAIAAGYYFFGKGGKAHRKEASVWGEKAKQELLKRIKDMKEVSKDNYQAALDEVLEKFKGLKNVDPDELKTFGKELMEHWEKISKEAEKLTKNTTAKKPAVVKE